MTSPSPFSCFARDLLGKPVSTFPDHALERAGHFRPRPRNMTKLLYAVPFVLFTFSASAQQGHDACARDVSRFCRAVMNDGDQVVLACLKQNRARLSRACEKVLTDHGQ